MKNCMKYASQAQQRVLRQKVLIKLTLEMSKASKIKVINFPQADEAASLGESSLHLDWSRMIQQTKGREWKPFSPAGSGSHR